MPLFEMSALQVRLPKHVIAYVSGSNRVSEIRGFAMLQIPVGVSVPHLTPKATKELIAARTPVMVDSGAFSEVRFDNQGRRHIVAPISHAEWRRRLAVYLRIARVLREKAVFVAPDQVGSQEVTLERLAQYRSTLLKLAATRATILIPLQVGALSHAAFYRRAQEVAGVPLTPALPLRKAITTLEETIDFVTEAKPERIHLLGLGADNRRGQNFIRAIQHYSPSTEVSLDSNRVRAVTGKARKLTVREAELRSDETEGYYGEVGSAVLEAVGERLDYTDVIATPSSWASDEQRERIARNCCMTGEQRRSFLADPDEFLQTVYIEGVSEEEGYGRWYEHPVMELELNRAWQKFVDGEVSGQVRTAAILDVFGDSMLRKAS